MITTYTLSVIDMRLSTEDDNKAVQAACDSLDGIFGSPAAVGAACAAHDEIFSRYGEWPLPAEATDAERISVDRWMDAERAATTAAIKASGYESWSMGGHLEITPQ